MAKATNISPASLGLRRGKSSTPSTHVTADRSRPMFLPELFGNFGHIAHEPRSDEGDENFGRRTKLAEKEGKGRTDRRPNSFRIFRCRSRRDTRRRKQTLKWRQTFSLSVVGLASFIHPWQAGARSSASAHAASPSALLSFFHFHFLLFFLLDLPPEGFPLYSRSLHLHFC